MNKKDILIRMITVICEGYVDSLLTGIEECPDDFPYTIAVANFISELREKNISADLFSSFGLNITDMVFRETSNSLAR